MNLAQMKEIADAVLYEGYLLYPYRLSAIKNQQRWTFGVIYPHSYSQSRGGTDPWCMLSECLLSGQPDTQLYVNVRFLHLLTRTSQRSSESWEEGIPREIEVRNLVLSELVKQPKRVEIDFPAEQLPVTAQDPSTREQQALQGAYMLSAELLGENVYKLRISIENMTPEGPLPSERRDAILLRSFVSAHVLMRVQHGSFVSLLDPPELLAALALRCQNRQLWPVLLGDDGDRNALLASPIILYDYPKIAPESVGSLFDGTEIDEILTLRILTLTDDEKREMRANDGRAREILERTENLTPEQFMKLHGVVRNLGPVLDEEDLYHEARPTATLIAGKEVRPGSRVRVHPKERADAFDLLLEGKTARVEAIQQDFEDRVYVVVTLDDDPGREQEDERVLPGHRFFFYTHEVEILEDLS